MRRCPVEDVELWPILPLSCSVPGPDTLKRDIGNRAAADLGQITRAVKRRRKMLQYRPEVIDGCLAATGLPLDL